MPSEPLQTTDILWPSDNRLGIPTLDLDMQATEVLLPVVPWGHVSRRARGVATWIHYVDDFKFACHWKDPAVMVRCNPAAVGECNYSMCGTLPLAAAHWHVYRKRWLSRYWQSQGIRVMVDLYVDERFADLNLLGVPRGWRAYCTRAADYQVDWLESEWHRVRSHAGGSVLLLVYGGGRVTRSWCSERGAVHVPHVAQTRRRSVSGTR